MYPKNNASPPRVAVGAVIQISDGAVQTSGVSIAVRGEGASEAAGGGTISFGASSSIVYYKPTQAETNHTAFVVTAYKTGCVPVSVTVITTNSSTAGKADVGLIAGQTASASGTVTFPAATLASTTNITAGTITTASNLTNLPSIPANWLTATGIASGAFTSSKFAAGAFDAVWSVTTRSLTTFGTLINDIWASVSRTITGTVTLDASQPNYAPAKAGDAMALTSGERTTFGNVLEAMMLDEGDASALLAAISAKVEEFLINEGDASATLAAMAAAVRTNLATELARIDVAVSTRNAIAPATPLNVTDAQTAIQTDVAAVQTGVSQLLARVTATLFSGITSMANWLGTLAGSAADAPTLAEINATTAGATFANTDDSLQSIRDRGDAAWTGGGGGGGVVGPGAIDAPVTIQLSGVPEAGVDVWVTTDEAGTNVIAGTLVSDAFGLVTFKLDAGTYYTWAQKAGIDFSATNPQTLVVS